MSESTTTKILSDYDIIVINTSGGKDSQVMLDLIATTAAEAGLTDRLRAVHADLGRVEWPGTKELAAEQATHYGLELVIVEKKDTEAAPRDLLERVEKRGMWPSSQQRWCTSDHKRGAIRPYFTALAKQWRTENPDAGRPCRILSVMGMRAQESAARAKRPTFVPGVVSSRNQVVDEFLPIHDWTEGDVWQTIKASGVRHHEAYDKGMSRLSCSFCVLASRADLVLAAQLRPELAAEYAAVEKRIDHTFQSGTAMAEIIEQAKAANASETPVTLGS